MRFVLWWGIFVKDLKRFVVVNDCARMGELMPSIIRCNDMYQYCRQGEDMVHVFQTY